MSGLTENRDFNPLKMSVYGAESLPNSYPGPNVSGSRSSSYSSEGVEESVSSSNLSTTMGALTVEERREKVKKYWEKKKRRTSQKHVRYECRKNLAEKRFRF